MSKEETKVFLERIKNDEEFAKKILSLESSNELDNFLQGEGFNLNTDNIKELNDELSDTELESITGGFVNLWKKCNSKHCNKQVLFLVDYCAPLCESLDKFEPKPGDIIPI